MGRKRVYASEDAKGRRLEAVNKYKEDRKLKRVVMDLPEDEVQAIRSFAADHGISVTSLYRQSVSYFMDHPELIKDKKANADATADAVNDSLTWFT